MSEKIYYTKACRHEGCNNDAVKGLSIGEGRIADDLCAKHARKEYSDNLRHFFYTVKCGQF